MLIFWRNLLKIVLMKNPLLHVSFVCRRPLSVLGLLLTCCFLSSCYYRSYPSSYYGGPYQVSRPAPYQGQGQSGVNQSRMAGYPVRQAPAAPRSLAQQRVSVPSNQVRSGYRNPSYARWNTGRGWPPRQQPNYYSYNARGAGEAWRGGGRNRGTRLQPGATGTTYAPAPQRTQPTQPVANQHPQYATSGHNQSASQWQQLGYGPATMAVGAYRVVVGDTLTGIARSHGTTVSALRQLNGISGDLIQPGLMIRLPVAIR